MTVAFEATSEENLLTRSIDPEKYVPQQNMTQLMSGWIRYLAKRQGDEVFPHGTDLMCALGSPIASTGNVGTLPTYSGLVRAVLTAYKTHQNLVLRPDDAFIAILAQFSAYVNGRAEELRDKFVAHEEQIDVPVSTGGSACAAPYGTMTREFLEQISENIKDPTLEGWFLAGFSTATFEDEIAASASAMCAFQSYGTFEMVCDIPQITLEGTVEDWTKLREKVERHIEVDDSEMVSCARNHRCHSSVAILDNSNGSSYRDFTRIREGMDDDSDSPSQTSSKQPVRGNKTSPTLPSRRASTGGDLASTRRQSRKQELNDLPDLDGNPDQIKLNLNFSPNSPRITVAPRRQSRHSRTGTSSRRMPSKRNLMKNNASSEEGTKNLPLSVLVARQRSSRNLEETTIPLPSERLWKPDRHRRRASATGTRPVAPKREQKGSLQQACTALDSKGALGRMKANMTANNSSSRKEEQTTPTTAAPRPAAPSRQGPPKRNSGGCLQQLCSTVDDSDHQALGRMKRMMTTAKNKRN